MSNIPKMGHLPTPVGHMNSRGEVAKSWDNYGGE